MAMRLTQQARRKLIEVGDALDIDQQLAVGDGGEVFVNPLEERADHAEREREGPAGGQGPQRRPGPGEGPRQEAGPGEAARLGGQSLAEHYLAGEADVRERYDAKFYKTSVGLWVVSPSNPLGIGGPQFHLAVFLPDRLDQRVAAWAASKLGDFPKFVGRKAQTMKHGFRLTAFARF
jgi:hypothetical protein